MEEKNLQSIQIHLVNGRLARLKLIIYPDNTLETAIITDDSIQEKVFSKRFEDEESALGFFDYLKQDRDVPEPVGRYKKLAVDLEKAKLYAKGRMGNDDSGAFNFDSVSVYLPRWREKLVINAAKTAGVDCFKRRRSSWYLFSLPEAGDCLMRTKAVKAMSDFLNNIGYRTYVFYMLD